MKRTAIVLIFIMGAGLAGCATVWDKPGLNATELNQDSFECRQDANRVSIDLLSPWETYLQREQVMDRCMEARGYTKQ